jgi:hypothetical protein
MVRGQTFAICEQANRASRHFPGMDEPSLPFLQICRKAPAAEKAMKKGSFDNHANHILAVGRLSADYFKNLTIGK